MAETIFIEFTDSGRPFAAVTSDGLRWDVEYCEADGLLYYHCCAGGRTRPPYLEGSGHKYWSAPGVDVVLGDNAPAPPENRLADVPEEYRAHIHKWQDSVQERWGLSFGFVED